MPDLISSALEKKGTAAAPRTGLPRLWSLTRRSGRRWLDHEGPRLAASLSFYTLLSLTPLVILIIVIASLGFGRAAAQRAVIAEIRDVMGDAGATVMRNLIEYGNAPWRGGLASALGLLTLLFGASSVFRELRSALNKVWDAPNVQGSGVFALVKSRLFALLMALGFLLLVSLLLSTGLTTASGYFRTRLLLPAPAFRVLSSSLSFTVIAALIAVLFKYVPNVKLRWREVFEGALLTALLFAAGKTVLGEYLSQAAVHSAYGAAGSVIAGTLWLYYSAMIFYFGAEFTRVRAEAARGVRR
ncbi:MAG: YihY/virulence factor BrkB family protein [Gammaproteobacteria bacterium]|nr:YihY/virulence factor BrkB family protein [Gammaproteobacteria bacterium]